MGHIVDVVAVVATILGVAQTLGFGGQPFVSGLHRIGFGDWLIVAETGDPSTAGVITALLIIMDAFTLSALSGVGKGIKWLSNINMGLSFFLLAFFLLFGSTFFGLSALVEGLIAYISQLPKLLFTVWATDGVEGSEAAQLASWQGGWSASIGPGGSHLRHSSACSLRVFHADARFANTSLGQSSSRL